jgi:hypothetical protein
MSGSGPFGPSLNGVWQSLQPAIVTRYFPRSTISPLVGVASIAAPWEQDAASIEIAATAVNVAVNRILRIVLPFCLV